MKYKVKLFMNQYVKVGDEYQVVDTSRTFKFKEWDDVQNFIGYMVEGAELGWMICAVAWFGFGFMVTTTIMTA